MRVRSKLTQIEEKTNNLAIHRTIGFSPLSFLSAQPTKGVRLSDLKVGTLTNTHSGVEHVHSKQVAVRILMIQERETMKERNKMKE